jgi:valyl-tRNA synthetase
VFGYLFQFVPEYVRALMQASPYKIFSFEGILFSNERSTHMIQLFNLFDTIYTFKMKLGIKKHQSISLFLKTDPNSLQVFRKYQPVFQQVLHIKDIVFVRLHEPDPRGYDQEIFEGITIGIKPAPEGNCSGEMTLAELEFSYAKKLEYLEYLRSLLTSPSIEPESLSDKQKEVEQTKVELDTLYIKIQKLKMRR